MIGCLKDRINIFFIIVLITIKSALENGSKLWNYGTINRSMGSHIFLFISLRRNWTILFELSKLNLLYSFD